MQAVATIGLDIAKSVFQVHGVDAQARLSCAGGCGVQGYRRFSKSSRPVLSGSKPAHHRITEHVHCRRSVIPFA
jgi:hypothetical protein